MSESISLVIIAFNEERNIERCIKSVPFARQIIVVDSFSKDQTSEKAKALGAKVFQKEFLGFREQKNYALSLASESWILSLDADEALSVELAEEISNVLKNPSEFDAYKMPRLSFHLGRWIKHGGWYPDYQTRLFKKSAAKWSGGEIHEYVEVKGKVGVLKNNLQHFVFENIFDQIKTNNKYSSHGAIQLFKTDKSFSLLKLVFKPFGKFFECYFWKLGFLDGAAGFIIALAAAQSMFLKHAKLWELHDFNEQRPNA